MSVNSLYGTMNRAEGLSIGDILKGVQSGSIPSYVGIPLIEKKTKEAQKMQAMQALMRQMEGGPPSTVTDQVMQAADQVTRPENPLTPTSLATGRQQPAPNMGIETAQSNMPQEYAGGGIVAFADTGAVKAAGNMDDNRFVNDPYLGVLDPIWDTEALKSRRYFKSLDKDEPPQRIQGPKGAAPIMAAPDAPSELDTVSRIIGGPNASAPTLQAPARPQIPLGTAPGATPETPSNTGLTIERGVNAPPAAAPQTPAPSAFSGIEDLYKANLDRSRADRDELRSMILGQKADRAEREAENRNTALMKAGFGMMAGQSPFAGVNIGRGAMEGVESYGRGLEQLRRDDRSTIQQLASLGLKGQELEQAAMKMGIDMSHYKMLEPYYQSAAAENIAKLGTYPSQQELLGAEAARQLASANEANMRTALLPGEQDIKRLKQVAAGYKGTPGAGQFMSKLQEWRRGAYSDPASSGVMFDAEITKGLTYPKESPTYQRALAAARSTIDDAFAQNVREFQYVGGSREGGSSSSE